ncbi:Pre-mRNA-splicing factor cwc26 [Sporothrix curviconia]|uniref:Pre-mRNA-splicing factor cwc26 n=1 Tax=Sporothrix curviconia TaxID=1260050 RepID=A0ABP0C4K3_9PEZI
MPDTDLTSFLASRYLVADEKPTKKRKRKDKSGRKNAVAESLLIQDDDDFGWSSTGRRGGGGDDDNDDDDENDISKIVGAGGGYGSGGTVAGTSAEFRKTKKSNWTVVGGGDDDDNKNSKPTKNVSFDTEADAVIAAAAADAKAAMAAQDEAPVIDPASSNPVLMSDGTHAGLQSAASVTAQLERRRREERDQYERERQEKRERRRQRREERGEGGGDDDDRSEGEEEVVYRDATGRRVDVALRRHEARQAAVAAEQKERAAKEALLGDVQREQARQRREELADAALLPLARKADDEDMNRELKAQTRWNDPMAAFLRPAAATSRGGATGSGKSKSAAASKAERPVYRGPAAPNRYGIRPGYRWDGVDRSIGFEAERFKAINRKERTRDLEYQWQMDV